jgi:xanthine dehydrogenase accessory factor
MPGYGITVSDDCDVKNIYHSLLKELVSDRKVCLSTLVGTRGSVPQVMGASALFSESGLLTGTLGGGILEGYATDKASEALKTKASVIYEFDLNADITAEEGAICGGSAIVLMDAAPEQSMTVFEDMISSLSKGKTGVLATLIKGRKKVQLERYWFEQGETGEVLRDMEGFDDKMSACIEKNLSQRLEGPDESTLFLEPVRPLPKLYIVGAGHIGRALAHHANLLDFEVSIIDDRAEYANAENIPDADNIIVGKIGKAVEKIPKSSDTFIVIVTRGHRDDGDALRACIGSDLPYIGMIGSKKKVRLMRENFISRGWSTAEEFDLVHSPVGLEIGSKTVQEIAVSVAAQLIQVRNQAKKTSSKHLVSAIILAAGESSRMGKPKMLLPYERSSIIETVIGNAALSSIDKTYVVLGAGHESITQKIQDNPVETVINPNYKSGMLSSVQCGLRALSDSTTQVMVLLGDQPMIGERIMDRMILRYNQSEKGIVVASWQGKRGHPILFSSEYIKEILDYPEDGSLKSLLLNHPDDIDELETENPEILRDIDTEQDYQKEYKLQQK